MKTLQANDTLQGGKYKIIRVLGQGGFGITYLAEQVSLERKVAVKEFFFKQFCDRDPQTGSITHGVDANQEIVEKFQGKFLKEAKTISRFSHPNIVQVFDVFSENNTAYYVMEYIEGNSLDDLVKQNGPLPEKKALEYINDAGNALSYIHSMNINHLDIKPANIMLRSKDKRILVIDFGVSKQYNADTLEGTTTTPVGISHGYSPLEQYKKNGVQTFSPQSDVYSLAATLIKLLTGVTPPEALEIQESGVPVKLLQKNNVSNSTIYAICQAMKSRFDRTQTISQFLAQLNVEPSVQADGPDESTSFVDDSTTMPEDKNPEVKDSDKNKSARNGNMSKAEQLSNAKKSSKAVYIAIISVVTIAVIAAVYAVFFYKNSAEKAADAPYNSITSGNIDDIEVNTDDVPSDDPSIVINPNGDVKAQLEQHYDKVLNLNGGFYKIIEDNKYGLADAKGKIIERPKYDEINSRNHLGLILVKKDGKMGYLNLKGVEVLAPVYDNIEEPSNGLMKVQQNNKFGFVDINTLKEVTPCIYTYIYELEDDRYKVLDGAKEGYLNKDGSVQVAAH